MWWVRRDPVRRRGSPPRHRGHRKIGSKTARPWIRRGRCCTPAACHLGRRTTWSLRGSPGARIRWQSCQEKSSGGRRSGWGRWGVWVGPGQRIGIRLLKLAKALACQPGEPGGLGHVSVGAAKKLLGEPPPDFPSIRSPVLGHGRIGVEIRIFRRACAGRALPRTPSRSGGAPMEVLHT